MQYDKRRLYTSPCVSFDFFTHVHPVDGFWTCTVTCRQFPNLTFAPRKTCHFQAATSRFIAIMPQQVVVYMGFVQIARVFFYFFVKHFCTEVCTFFRNECLAASAGTFFLHILSVTFPGCSGITAYSTGGCYSADVSLQHWQSCFLFFWMFFTHVPLFSLCFLQGNLYNSNKINDSL